jgi:hypothetical protein
MTNVTTTAAVESKKCDEACNTKKMVKHAQREKESTRRISRAKIRERETSPNYTVMGFSFRERGQTSFWPDFELLHLATANIIRWHRARDEAKSKRVPTSASATQV